MFINKIIPRIFNAFKPKTYRLTLEDLYTIRFTNRGSAIYFYQQTIYDNGKFRYKWKPSTYILHSEIKAIYNFYLYNTYIQRI